MNTIKLKNGTEELEQLVTITMMSLRDLIDNHPIVFYELVMLCRYPKHEPWGDTASKLKDYGMLEPNNRVHDSIRNIVLSATVGDGLDMMLVSPLA